MALTKISTAMISQSAAAVDLNVDAGTFYVDTTNNRVGVGGKTDPDTPLHVVGTVTATTFAGSGASLTNIPNSALTNSSITINSTATSLGGSITLGTDQVAEGSSNLYYTNARADARIAAADTDDLSEGSSNLYYTDARVDARVSGGSLGNITTTGYIRGPATFTLDPAAHGDNTGTVVIAGNLQVDGTTTTINSTTMTVDDKNITLASGSANAAAANGAGFTVDIGTGTNPAITYDGTNDEWDFNKKLNVTGSVTSTTGFTTSANTRVQASSGMLFLNGPSAVTFEVGAGSEKMRLLSDGLAIGSQSVFTTGGAAKLSVAGILSIGISNSDMSYIRRQSTGNYAWQTYDNNNTGSIQLQPYGGKVGIGTTSPSEKLEVSGGHIRITDASGGSYFKAVQSTNGANAGFFMASGSSNWYTLVDTSGKYQIYDGDAAEIRMLVDGSGNVGIGTSSPSGGLHVANSFIRVDSSEGIAARKVRSGYFSNGQNLILESGSAANIIMDTTKVGIGTSSPNTELQINGATDPKIRLESNESGSKRLDLWIDGGEAIGYIAADQSASQLAFRTTGTERMRINSAGNVGIGTTSPTNKLHVVGNQFNTGQVRANTGTAASPNFTIDGGAGMFKPTSNVIGFSTNSTERLRITTGGNVGIGTTSPTGISGAKVLEIKNPSTGSGTHAQLTLTGSNGHTNLLLASGDDTTGGDPVISSTTNHAIRFGHSTNSTFSGFAEHMRITDTGNVGIGTASPNAYSNQTTLTINGTTYGRIDLETGGIVRTSLFSQAANTTLSVGSGFFTIDCGGSERVRLDTSGNLLVGTTSTTVGAAGSGTTGFRVDGANGIVQVASDGTTAAIFNRTSNNGDVIDLRRDGTTVGSISVNGGYLGVGAGAVYLGYYTSGSTKSIIPMGNATGGAAAGTIDLGLSLANHKFKDLYLSGNAYLNNGYVTSLLGANDTNTYINFAGNDQTRFYQGGTERARFDGEGLRLATGSSIIRDYRTLYNGSAAANTVQYIKLYDRGTTTAASENLHFYMRGFNHSEYSVEVKIFIPTYSGFTTSYGTMDAGQGIEVEIICGGLSSQGNVFQEIIEVANLSSTSDNTEIWLKTQVPHATTGISISEAADSTDTLIPTGNGSGWTTTAPSNQHRVFPIKIGKTINGIHTTRDSKLGIGTDSPNARLNLKLSSRGSSDFRITDSDTSNDVLRAGSQADGDGFLQLRTIAGAGNVLFDASGVSYITGGNVGIGTASPASKLSVQGDGIVFRLDGTANTDRTMLFRNVGTGEGIVRTDGNMHLLQEDANRYMRFSTANTERMRIMADGQIRIGNGSAQRPIIQTTNWGYSASYRVALLGSASTTYNTAGTGSITLAMNYDPAGNADSSFGGDGREILFRRSTQFVTPNSADNDFYLYNLVLQDGDVLIGSTTNLNVLSGTPKLQIGSGTGHASLQFYSGTTSVNGIYFGDTSSANNNRYSGYIEYRHNDDTMAFRAASTSVMTLKSNGPLLPAGNFGYHTTQERYNASSNPSSFSTATNVTYNNSTEYWPDQGEKMICVVNARAFTKYLHIKTNLTTNNVMFYFRTKGYFYSHGMEEQLIGGYTYYSGGNIILSKSNETVAGNTHSGDTYRASDGSLVLKMQVDHTGYTEGRMLVFFHSHSPSVTSALTVTAVTQKDDGTNAF